MKVAHLQLAVNTGVTAFDNSKTAQSPFFQLNGGLYFVYASRAASRKKVLNIPSRYIKRYPQDVAAMPSTLNQ